MIHQRWQEQLREGTSHVLLASASDIERYGIKYIVNLFQRCVTSCSEGSANALSNSVIGHQQYPFVLELDCGSYPGWVIEAICSGVTRLRWDDTLESSHKLKALSEKYGVQFCLNKEPAYENNPQS